VASPGMGHWGTCPPLEFANALKFVVCSVERDIVQQIDIERVVHRFDALAHAEPSLGVKVNRTI